MRQKIRQSNILKMRKYLDFIKTAKHQHNHEQFNLIYLLIYDEQPKH